MKVQALENKFSFIRENNFYFELINIENKDFQRLYSLFNKFRAKARNDECIDDEYWNYFYKIINLYRYRSALLPVPFNSKSEISEEQDNHMIKSISNISEYYPNYKSLVNEIIILWNYLRSSESNPYAEEISKICMNNRNTSVYLIYKDYSLSDNEKNLLQNKCKNLKFKNLKKYKIQDKINEISIFLGSRSWYDNDIFTMPLSKKIIFIGYNGIYRSKKDIPIFRSLLWDISKTTKENSIEVLDTEINLQYEESIDDRPDRLEDEVTIKILTKKLGIDENNSEKSTCKKVNFRSEHICFLRNDEHDHSQQLLLIDGDKKQIKSSEIDKISTGDFVLLRMKGLGNEIVDEANKLLGEKYIELRSIQTQWKEDLKKHIETFGVNRLVNSLIEEGVNAYNSKVYFWAYNKRNIKTKYPNDFRKLMKVIGKEDMFDYWFDGLKQLDNAHRKVQPIIRKRLLKVIVAADLSDLYSYGFQEFTLPHTTSKLGIFEVSRISNENIVLPIAIMDQPIHRSLKI